MKGEKLEINRIIDTEMLSLNPAFHAYIEKELTEKVGAALMMRIGLSGEEYIVSSGVKEEQIETLNSVNVKATANIKRLVRCKDCKYNLSNERQYDDPDPIMTYAWCNTEAFQENDFCSKGKRRES